MTMPKWLDKVLTDATPACNDIVRWVSLEAEQQLPWYRKLQMHAHFLICEFCKRYREQLFTLRTLLRAAPEKLTDTVEKNPAQLPADAKQRIKDALRNQSK